MPIYEYRCESCHQELEKLQKISDPPLVVCPACGKPALKKLVSASSFRLKGTGWYVTDFKDNKGKKPSKESEGGQGKQDKPAADTGGKDSKAGSDGKTGSETKSGGTGKTEKAGTQKTGSG